MISFVVPGVPVGQGNMKGFAVAGRVRIVHARSEELMSFRDSVGYHAREAGASPVDGPVSLEIEFVLPRPKNHFGTGRNAGVLKASAPRFVDKRPDADKLLRAVLDALTHVAYRDDSQVSQLTVRKVYGAPATRVVIRPLQEAVPGSERIEKREDVT